MDTKVRPTYAGAFRCIGANCEDTCCRDWSIPLDKRTYEKYREFPEGKLGSLVKHFVSITPDAPENLFAQINLAPSGFCPFFTPDQCCGIQKEHGAQALSATCSIYPRALNLVEGELEGSLHLSCPEAARNILLVPDSLETKADLFSGEFRTDNVFRLATSGIEGAYKPYRTFHAVRALLVELVRDRARPMWQRLLLVGSLCKRLDAVTTPEQEESIPAMLDEYHQIVQNNWLHAELEGMPRHPGLQLDVILRLTEARTSVVGAEDRFGGTFQAFLQGVGVRNAQPEQIVERYVEAEAAYHRPFFERSPFILENYLLNLIFQTLFPFGREGSPHLSALGIFDEYVLLATQYAWINGLLIGVSGRYKQTFDEDHVVWAIQSFSRAVEHSPFVLKSMHEHIRSRKMDSMDGMSIMLRI
jgi:lysine-N-methylase